MSSGCLIRSLSYNSMWAEPWAGFQIYLIEEQPPIRLDGGLIALELTKSVMFSPTRHCLDLPTDNLVGYVIDLTLEFVNSSPTVNISHDLVEKWTEMLPVIFQDEGWVSKLFNLCKIYQQVAQVTVQPTGLYNNLFGYLAIGYMYDLHAMNIPWLAPRAQLSGMLRTFLSLLEAEFLVHKRPIHYARQLCVSESSLLKECQKKFGKSTSEIIQQRVMKEAKRQLVETNRSIGDIADDLNFVTLSYFSERFRQIANTSPTVFRRLYQNVT